MCPHRQGGCRPRLKTRSRSSLTRGSGWTMRAAPDRRSTLISENMIRRFWVGYQKLMGFENDADMTRTGWKTGQGSLSRTVCTRSSRTRMSKPAFPFRSSVATVPPWTPRYIKVGLAITRSQCYNLFKAVRTALRWDTWHASALRIRPNTPTAIRSVCCGIV